MTPVYPVKFPFAAARLSRRRRQPAKFPTQETSRLLCTALACPPGFCSRQSCPFFRIPGAADARPECATAPRTSRPPKKLAPSVRRPSTDRLHFFLSGGRLKQHNADLMMSSFFFLIHSKAPSQHNCARAATPLPSPAAPSVCARAGHGVSQHRPPKRRLAMPSPAWRYSLQSSSQRHGWPGAFSTPPLGRSRRQMKAPRRSQP